MTGLDVNVEEYVESTARPYLMDVIYCWSKGANFSEVIQMTDIFEGSIIRLARRLDEFLNQLKAVASESGEHVCRGKCQLPLLVAAMVASSDKLYKPSNCSPLYKCKIFVFTKFRKLLKSDE
ncbi:DExH-box ATP-dependent RNA helicase DExH10-like [Beta vulgaris subsp. vulgaris]|uniref:DExH-box ATP-dependent RNA helicase DExH10-like n=1 Tax=Beta vulgaris subsp. vulgaris TaxID=3555 RepID=UPI0025483D7E|nr:DExH-box ATP-dependent RNA helicase DExH10-like [Beta vulgaris subsp. vulgaris]